MNFTKNFSLKKPSYDDFVDIGDLNGNADIIDRELAKRAELDENGKVLASQLPEQIGSGIIEKIEDLEDRVRAVELACGAIASNSFAVTFGSLYGTTTTDGIWNVTDRRLEF